MNKQNCLLSQTVIWRKTLAATKAMMSKRRFMVKRFLLPITAFLLGSAFIASFYIGIPTWAQGWEYASSQFVRDRWYVIPIIVGFGVQAALYFS
jgi:hypothetical protein